MKQNKEPQRFPVEPETVMAAYEILIKNCRNHHDTCQGCPLHITDPEPYPSGIRDRPAPHFRAAIYRRQHGRSLTRKTRTESRS